MYKIYWIKYKEYSEPLKEGYIGLTYQDINERLKEHKYNKKNKLLSNRCKKEIVEIICLHDNLTKEEAIRLEEHYRPIENIGWNINKGGDIPPSRKGKQSPRCLLKGNNRTEKQKLASKKHSQRMKGNNSSGKRKNRIIHKKECENCKCIFIAKSKNTKYCNLKCAAQKRNTNLDYINKLKKATTDRWKNDEYKKRVSELIRKSLGA
jgi:predicted GIY-YIG superfamily endonuclease